jgi:hypothetical protein
MGLIGLCAIDGHIAAGLLEGARLLSLLHGDGFVLRFTRMTQAHGVFLPSFPQKRRPNSIDAETALNNSKKRLSTSST